MAFLADASSADATFTWPSSSTSIFTPVRSMMLRIILPPGPMTSRILSTGILIVTMRGAMLLTSARGRGQRLGHLAEDVEAALARLLERLPHDLGGDAGRP